MSYGKLEIDLQSCFLDLNLYLLTLIQHQDVIHEFVLFK
jgi:hypothetical protein